MNSYDDYKTRTDLDDVDRRWEGVRDVTVQCVGCGESFDVDFDERPPYRCERCLKPTVSQQRKTA